MDSTYGMFFKLSQASILLPFLIGISRSGKQSVEQLLLLGLVTLSLLTEALGFYININQLADSNLAVYNIYVVILFVFLNRIYLEILQWKYIKLSLNILLVSFVLFALVNVIFWQPIHTFHSNTITVSLVVSMVLSVAYFYQWLNKAGDLSWKNKPMFWFNSGILIYSSGALLLFVFIERALSSSSETIGSLWAFNAFLNIMLNCFYTLSLWIRTKS
jgi:hypothetical protein